VARILLGLDGSDIARHAAQRALSILAGHHDVTVARVVLPPAPVAMEPGAVLGSAVTLGAQPGEDAVEDLVAEAESELAATAGALGVTASVRVVVGDPGPELCRLAAAGSYDLVVVGSHGSGVIKRVLLGSVSHHVLHHAPCPVMIVRAT
jgi:nucleotide-binding universal stress UspA family protein